MLSTFNMKTSYIHILHLLCIVWLLLTVHCDSIPEIVLNRTIKIRFPEDTFNEFYQCLCNIQTNNCTGHLSHSGDGYSVTHITESLLDQNGRTGYDFKVYYCILSKTQTNTFNNFTCERTISRYNEECNKRNMTCLDCENGTAIGEWSNIQSITLNNVDSKSPDEEKDEKSDSVPIIAGAVSGAVFIILIIIIILIACKLRKKKTTATEQIPKALKQPPADAPGPNVYTTVSNYEEGYQGPYVTESSNKPNGIPGKSKKDKDNYDYCTVGFTNTSDLDADAIVIGHGSPEVNGKGGKSGPGPYLEKHQSTNDAMYSTVDIDDKGTNLYSQSSNAASTEACNVEYAVVDKSKKTSSNQKPNFDTEDEDGRPSSTVSISKISDNGASAPVSCEYAEVKKPNPNPKNIYAKLGEEIRDFKNPYNVM